MKILHVTEAMGGGIVTVLQSLAERQSELGADVTVAYTRRPSTPERSKLALMFGNTQLIEISGGRIYSLVRLGIMVRRARKKSFNAIHLHSSIAGAVGRLLIFGSRGAPVFYSPHGFSFLREHRHKLELALLRNVERALVKPTASMIVTSQTEVDIARNQLSVAEPRLVNTGVDYVKAAQQRTATHDRNRTPTIAMIGRVTYQKAPWRFATVADQFASSARFLWFGVSPDDGSPTWLSSPNVEKVGWMDPVDLDEALSQVDILLFPTLWEGMPFGLMMAQVRGIPAVVSDVVGNRDAVCHGVSGFIARNDKELSEYVKILITDTDLRLRLSAGARKWGEAHLTDRDLGRQTLEIYKEFAK